MAPPILLYTSAMGLSGHYMRVRPSNGHVTKIQRCPQLLPLLATLFWQHRTTGPDTLPTTSFFFSFFPARPFVNYFVPNISHRYGIQKYRNPDELWIELVFLEKKRKNKQTNNVVVYNVPTLVPSTYPTVNGPGQRTPSVVCNSVAATGS
jgi:hypothetical protein